MVGKGYGRRVKQLVTWHMHPGSRDMNADLSFLHFILSGPSAYGVLLPYLRKKESFSFRNSLLAVIESLSLSSWQSNYHKFVPCQLDNQTYSFCVMTFLPLWPLAHDQLMIKAFSPPLHSTRWSPPWLPSGHPSCCPRVELQVSL